MIPYRVVPQIHASTGKWSWEIHGPNGCVCMSFHDYPTAQHAMRAGRRFVATLMMRGVQ